MDLACAKTLFFWQSISRTSDELGNSLKAEKKNLIFYLLDFISLSSTQKSPMYGLLVMSDKLFRGISKLKSSLAHLSFC